MLEKKKYSLKEISYKSVVRLEGLSGEEAMKENTSSRVAYIRGFVCLSPS